MNATPPANKPEAPQADAVSQGYAKKAESVRGSKNCLLYTSDAADE